LAGLRLAILSQRLAIGPIIGPAPRPRRPDRSVRRDPDCSRL